MRFVFRFVLKRSDVLLAMPVSFFLPFLNENKTKRQNDVQLETWCIPVPSADSRHSAWCRVLCCKRARGKMQNPPRRGPTIVKKRSKIYEKSIKIWSKIDLGGSWGGLGAVLTPRWPPERKRRQKVKVLPPYWGPFWGSKSIKIDPKSDLKCNQFFDRFGSRVLDQLGANLAPCWLQKPPQNGAKLAPKSIQVGVLIWEVFFDVCWAVFYWFVGSTWHGRSG